MSQGGIRNAQPLNAAVNGQGFFVMQSETSQQHLFTRASDFVFAADGSLIDVFGRKIKGYRMVNGVADKSELVDISVNPEEYNLSDIGFEDGGILTTNFNSREAARENGESVEDFPEGEQTFQLALAKIPNPSQMELTQRQCIHCHLRSGNS